MRLVFTSDLHVEYHLEVVGLVAERARELAPDALVLAGDVCPDLHRLERALRLIAEAVKVPVLYLPGNHELWCGGARGSGPDSRERYLKVIPRIARRAGVLPLGLEPQLVGNLGFAGVTGWYDYSLQDPVLSDSVTATDYAAKRLDELRCVDGSQVHWPGDDGEGLSDEALCETMCELLRGQLDDVVQRRNRVVVVTHMLPSRALLDGRKGQRARDPEERFLDAFMGSKRLAQVILSHPSVVRVICGHYHHAVSERLMGTAGEIPCDISPVGYPRELESSLADHVSQRLRVVEV